MLRPTLLLTGIAACLLGLSEAALAGSGTLKSMSASLSATDANGFGAIHIVSEDGVKWSKIKSGRLDLEGNISARMKIGYILQYHIRLGTCGDTAQCNSAPFPIIYGPFNTGAGLVTHIGGDVHFSIDPAIAGLSTGQAIGLQPSFDTMVATCNVRLDLIHQGHNFDTSFNATFAIETTGTILSVPQHFNEGTIGVNFRKTFSVPVKVVCDPAPERLGLANPPTPFKVTEAELFLATFKGDSSVPSEGASCKTLRVTARFKTTAAGVVHFDFSHEVGDQGLGTTPVTVAAKAKPDGTYAAEYVKDYPLDKPTHAQFFVQETNGLGVSAGWKEIDVACSGELADPASQPPSDEPEFRVLKSDFTVTTFAGDSPRGCPVNAALDVEFIANKPGGVPFQVTGTDGFVWNFSIKADEPAGPLQLGDGQASYGETYRAKYRRMISVTKSTDAMYSLQVRNVAVEPDAKTAGPDNLVVHCGGDLAVPFAVSETELSIVDLPGCPTTAFASASFVANASGDVRYRLAATTGDVATGSAVTKQVAGRFVAKVVMPVKITHGGEVVFTAVPLDFPKKLALAKRGYNCGGSRPGDVSAGAEPKPHVDPPKVVTADPKVVIDPPRHDIPKKEIVPVIVTPKAPICQGGTVRAGRCFCLAGFKPVAAGPNAFRCMQSAPLVSGTPKLAVPKRGPLKPAMPIPAAPKPAVPRLLLLPGMRH